MLSDIKFEKNSFLIFAQIEIWFCEERVRGNFFLYDRLRSGFCEKGEF